MTSIWPNGFVPRLFNNQDNWRIISFFFLLTTNYTQYIAVSCSLHICKRFCYAWYFITFTLIRSVGEKKSLFCMFMFSVSQIAFVRSIEVLSSFKLQFSMKVRYHDFEYRLHFQWTKLWAVAILFALFCSGPLLNRRKKLCFLPIAAVCCSTSVFHSFGSGEHMIQSLLLNGYNHSYFSSKFYNSFIYFVLFIGETGLTGNSFLYI